MRNARKIVFLHHKTINMKNIKFLTLIGLLSFGALFLTNCGSGSDDEVAPKPVLNFIGGSEYIDEDVSLSANTEFTMAITATHTSNMKTLTVTKSIDGGAEVSLIDSSISTKSITQVDVMGITEATEGLEVYTFTVADKDGNSTSKTITITNIGDGGADLAVLEKDNDNNPFRVYNFKGPNAGAYQIGVGSLTSGEPDNLKDIQDSTANDEIATWPARWTSRNGTTFKKASASAWATITNQKEISNAWDAAGEAMTEIDVEDEASYILNIKNAGKFALVTITDVVETSGNNSDYVEFIYKYEQ